MFTLKRKQLRNCWNHQTENIKLRMLALRSLLWAGCFLDYKMADSKTMISQVQELQVILHEIHVEGMSLSESLQVVCIIEKFSPAMKDFKNYLKQK